MNTEALEAFAAGRPSKTKDEWRPPEMGDFHYDSYWGRDVIAVDPSLRAFAAVFLSISEVMGQPQIFVLAARKFTTAEEDAKGWEANFQRAMQVGHDFRLWIDEATAGFSRVRLEIVHEQPPAGGGRIIRPEATILGGLATRFAARDLGVPVQRMVAPQSHKRLFCGAEKVTKAQHHAALKKTAAQLGISGMDLVKNEGTRDALSIGLMHCTRPMSDDA
jgi:hypothetical protein